MQLEEELLKDRFHKQLGFLTDITIHLNEHNLKLQGRNQLVSNLIGNVNRFHIRLKFSLSFLPLQVVGLKDNFLSLMTSILIFDFLFWSSSLWSEVDDPFFLMFVGGRIELETFISRVKSHQTDQQWSSYRVNLTRVVCSPVA